MMLSRTYKPAAILALGIGATMMLSACGKSDDKAQESSQTPKEVRFVLNAPYAPFEFADSNGKLQGFDVELGEAMCAEAKLDCSWHNQSWDSLIPSLLSRKGDAIMSAMTITDERKKQVIFSNPYIVQPSAWFAPTSADYSNVSPETIKGKRIGVQRGTLQDNYITDTYGNDNTVSRYGSVDDITIDLQAGRIDLAFVDYPIGKETFIDATHGQYKQVGSMINEPKKYFGDGFAIAFRPHDQALADTFNKALDTLKQNGQYTQLVKKYFGEDFATQK